MIRLSAETPLGTGRHRKCYAHPDDAQRCIKIVYNGGQGGDKETQRELKYYAHLSRYLKDWSGIPRYYGTVETDCGTGYVYDVIADYDGKPSITLTEFAKQCRYEDDFAVLRQLLKKLKRYLRDNHIVTMTLKPQNVLCHRISESEVVPVVCDNIGEARVLANELDALNQTRKEIEQGMQAEALTLCEKLERSRETLPGGLAMYHPEWHQGVVASRIKERFHRPVIAFAPAGDGTLKGSGRSIQGLHMRDALERLDTLHPGLMIKFGGHAMAAGLSLEEAKFDLFQQRFGELVTEWLDPSLLQGEVVSDGPLSAAEMTMEVAQLLRDAGPWGQMFPEPLFDGRFRLLQQRLVGERHLKVMVEPVGGGPLLDGIAFNVDTACWPDNGVREVELAYKLDINEFRGNRSLQIIIDNIWPV